MLSYVFSPHPLCLCWCTYKLELHLHNYHCVPTISPSTCLYDILKYSHIGYTLPIYTHIVYGCTASSMRVSIFSRRISLTPPVQKYHIIIPHTRHQLLAPSISTLVSSHPTLHDPQLISPHLLLYTIFSHSL